MSFGNTFADLGIGFNGQDNLSVGFGHISHDIISQPQKRRAIIATIIDWLKNNRTPSIWHTFNEVFESADDGRCAGLSAEAKNKLKADMRANPKIQTDGDNAAYKPLHFGLSTKPQLSAYLRRYTHGIPLNELVDAYPGIDKDIQSLISEGVVQSIFNKERNRHILFPRHQEYELFMDDDLKKLWNEIHMPNANDLIDELRDANLISEKAYELAQVERGRAVTETTQVAATGMSDRLQELKRRARNRKKKNEKLTNTHLLNSETYKFLKEDGTVTSTDKK